MKYNYKGKEVEVQYLGKHICHAQALQADGTFKPVCYEAKFYKNIGR